MPRRKGDSKQRELQRAEDEEINRLEKAANLEKVYLMDATTLIERSSTDTPFVIDQIIPDEGICFLAGRPGSMKSWLAYDAALAVARGRPWLGFNVPKSGGVLVLNFDNPSHELGRRFVRLGLKPEDNIKFHSPAATLPKEGLPAMLQLPDSLDALHLLMMRLRPMLVIVDSYRQSHTGDEHSSRDMGRVMSCLRSLTGFGASILILHHLRKQGQQKDDTDDEPLRGSTEIQASADMIMIVKDGEMTFNKTRGWKTTFESVEYYVEDPSETTTAIRTKNDLSPLLALLEAEGAMLKREIMRELAIKRGALDHLVSKAMDAGLVRMRPRKHAHDQRLLELVGSSSSGSGGASKHQDHHDDHEDDIDDDDDDFDDDDDDLDEAADDDGEGDDEEKDPKKLN